jgi:protoporphyrinogen oxidase
MTTEKTNFCILGGGLSGLTFAYALARKNTDFRLLEKEQFSGGLARSIAYDGFTFDLGGHRLIFDSIPVFSEIEKILPGQLLSVSRRSRIKLNGAFFDYPVKPLNAACAFRPGTCGKIIASFLSAYLKNSLLQSQEVSFADFVRNRFGDYLYRLFFKGYTEKVWDMPGEQISRDWALKRVDLANLPDLIRKSFGKENKNRTCAKNFFYPHSKGIGALGSGLEQSIIRGPGQIRKRQKVVKISCRGNRVCSVTAEGQEGRVSYAAERFLSTIPLNQLIAAWDPLPPNDVREAVAALRYRDMIFAFFIIDRERISQDHWLYFPSPRTVFSRISEPKNWSTKMAPADKTSLCVEIFSSRHNSLWQQDDAQIIDSCVEGLVREGLLKKEEILHSFLQRVPDAYPVYALDYRRHLSIVLDFITQFPNLYLSGRTGRFNYLNMDKIMEEAFALAQADGS